MRRCGFSTKLWWLAALCCLVYATMWVGWARGWGWLAAADTATLDVGHRMGLEHHGWVTFWDVWCTVFSPVTLRIVTAGLIFYAFATRQVRTAIFLIVSVELSAVLTEVAKRLADRPRPDTAMVDALSTSFPSGHAVGTMVAVPALAVVLLPHVRREYRRWAVAAGVVVIVLVGVGRIALNVHHLSDVIAGWALGYLYLVACLPILRARRVTAADETPATLDTGR
ncbi:phosphatase PAP2 family protein [Mycobacterium antarcticum]|uniref:phosphatase PAP2 family protein n=1 Tax=unclassified Mycolicibacterium TaxID=2636767 RepID=UPI00238C57FE|nr:MULTISPECIES: phosphatase PAP2 family protein [unclassified Mycolicibacterium]GLP81651.1 phosphatase PAP2 family protein [Mycolicibacterium sp. TUM20984]